MTSYRMSPQARRTQLLDTAEHLFGVGPFEDVSMEQIALSAGVTRALVYHYFPTKADLFAAVWDRAHQSLRTSVDFDDVHTVHEGLIATLTAYLTFYEHHLPLVVIANRSSIASTPTVRDPIDTNFELLCTTVLDAANASGQARQLASTAFTGWVGFIKETTLTTLIDKTITPAQNLTMCITALEATVGNYVDLHVTPGHPA